MEDPNIIYGGDFESREDLNLTSLAELVTKNLQNGGVRRGIINGLTGETWSFKELLDYSVKIAQGLHNAGVKQNDMIAIVSENCHEFMAAVCGAFLLNAIVAPFNYTYTKREIQHSFGLTNPKIVFASASSIENVVSVCEEFPCVQLIIMIDNSDHNRAISLKGFLEKYSRNTLDIYQHVIQKVNKQEQTAMIFNSSGTTGAPKGVEITQMNVLACMQTSRDNLKYLKEHDDNISNLNIAPWSHVMGFMTAFFSIMTAETTLVFLPKFEGELYLSCLEKYKITVIAVPPPIVVFLAKTPLLNKFNLSNLKIIFSGAAPLAKDVEDAAKKRFKHKIQIVQGYGMSEATLGVTGTYFELKPGTVGRVQSEVYAKVIDMNGRTLEANQVGELCFKGSRIMKGYIGNPKATAETIDKDGFLHSGDLGYYDEDFQFFIVDRLKELIKYKGFQVPPAEIEGLLLSHPKIKDAGVIGIPNDVAGELPFAFIVKQDNVAVTEKEVKDFIAANASNAKWLRGGVRFVAEIPKNPSGKILRRELRELYQNTKAKL